MLKKEAPKEEYYQDALTDVSMEIMHLLIKKHIDYGPKNLERFGLYGILIRVSDKLERLINIVERGEALVAEETIEDNLKDIAGYMQNALLLMRGKLDLPLKQKDVH